MAQLASHLLEFPPGEELTDRAYDQRIEEFLKSLQKIDKSKALKADSQQNFLQVLNPLVNSVSYLYILNLRLQDIARGKLSSPNEAQQLLLQSMGFLQQFDPIQMRYVAMDLRTLIEGTINLASHLQALSEIVTPLIAAIYRFDPSGGTLTSTHIKVLKICLTLRMYRESLPLLSATIHSFPASKPCPLEGQYLCSPHTDSTAYMTESGGITDKLSLYDVHEFFLLGGMIYIGLQQWEDAKLYLEYVLVSPSQGAPSVLQVEAYKKWVLICCVLRGTTMEAPRSANQNMLRAIRTIAKAYDAIDEIFQSRNIPRLFAEIAAGQQLWQEDGNLGLVMLLAARIPRFQILSMQNIYSAVPLSSVATWLNFRIDDIHAFIEKMVEEGALNADIDLSGAEPVLRFYSNQSQGPLAKTEKEYHAELIAQTKRTNAIAEYVKMSDRRLTLTKEYIEALKKRARNKEDGMASTGEPLDDRAPLEEDIMMDD